MDKVCPLHCSSYQSATSTSYNLYRCLLHQKALWSAAYSLISSKTPKHSIKYVYFVSAGPLLYCNSTSVPTDNNPNCDYNCNWSITVRYGSIESIWNKHIGFMLGRIYRWFWWTTLIFKYVLSFVKFASCSCISNRWVWLKITDKPNSDKLYPVLLK